MRLYKSIFIYSFMIFASMPAFITNDMGIKGLNMTNLLWILMIFFIFLPKFIPHKLKYTGFEKYVILLVLIIFISTIRGYVTYDYPFYQLWFYSFLKPLQYIILYIIIYNYFRTEKDIKIILIVNVLISIFLATILLWRYNQGLGELLTGQGFMSARTGGLYYMPNSLTLGFMFNLLILYFLFVQSRRLREKIFILLAGMPILLGILFSYTRKAYIIGILGIIIYSLLIKQRKKIRRILFALLTIGMIIFLAPDTIKTRAMTLGIFSAQNSFMGKSEEVRLEFAMSGIRYIKDNPEIIPFGGGVGSYEQNAYKYSENKFHKKGRDPHNTLLNYLCQVGLVGLVIIGLFYGKIISLCKKLRKLGRNSFTKNFGAMLVSQIIVYLLFATVTTNLLLWDAQSESIIFGSMVGCAFILRRNLVVGII